MLELTQENYYSTEANQEYMSYSQYKDFLTCEAAAMAKIYGGWEEPTSQAFLVGSYVHSWNDGTQKKFMVEHPEIFKKDGDLKAEFKVADVMIQTLENDPMAMTALEGEKEVIVVAEFAGVMWKSKMDVLNLEKKRFADLKTIRDLYEKVWNKREHRYQSWIEGYGYIGQMAAYRHFIKLAYGIETDPLLVAVTKEDPPDKAIIYFDNDRLQWEIEQIEKNMPRIIAVKSRQEKPNSCGTCRWCRETKKIDKVLHYSELFA